MGATWKKGRGKLGLLQPLLGRWEAEADSPMGPLRCTRVFESVLGGAYVRLEARWVFGAKARKAMPKKYACQGSGYEEFALIGVGDDGKVAFWSFTSDGKRSSGWAADVTDLHPEAVGFEAQMPSGFARMAYWPDGAGGCRWVVESRTKKGWKRFVEHRYRKVKQR
ncbi:MAG: hypothetical protein M5U26_28440 [Planctomycetota bacterium]|nr:hypothetical protein [Planctomycetota bacterium]